MQHYYGYYLLYDYELSCYIVYTDTMQCKPTWDIHKATRFDTYDDALDYKAQFEEDGYTLEVLFVEINIKPTED